MNCPTINRGSSEEKAQVEQNRTSTETTAEVPNKVVPVANSNISYGIFHSCFSAEHTVTKHSQMIFIYKTPHTPAYDTEVLLLVQKHCRSNIAPKASLC